MSIVDKLFQRQATRKQSLAEQYYGLLMDIKDDPDKATAQQVEQLDSLTTEMGLSAEQVTDDCETLRTLATLEPLAALKDERHKAWQSALQLKADSHRRTDEAINKLTAEHRAIENEASAASAKFQASNTAERQATDIRRRARHLFPNEPRFEPPTRKIETIQQVSLP